ncbi:MAG: prepilin peptidase [Hydrogenoanaerobacterium sp.]
MPVLIFIALFASYTVATITDLRSRYIPNLLPVLLTLFTFVHCMYKGVPLYIPLFNGAAALLFFLSLGLFGDYLLKRKGKDGCALGGGDIKLLSATACCIGFQSALVILLFSQLGLAAWLLLQKIRGKRTATAVPLAPFMLVGLGALCLVSLI